MGESWRLLPAEGKERFKALALDANAKSAAAAATAASDIQQLQGGGAEAMDEEEEEGEAAGGGLAVAAPAPCPAPKRSSSTHQSKAKPARSSKSKGSRLTASAAGASGGGSGGGGDLLLSRCFSGGGPSGLIPDYIDLKHGASAPRSGSRGRGGRGEEDEDEVEGGLEEVEGTPPPPLSVAFVAARMQVRDSERAASLLISTCRFLPLQLPRRRRDALPGRPAFCRLSLSGRLIPLPARGGPQPRRLRGGGARRPRRRPGWKGGPRRGARSLACSFSLPRF